MKETLIINIGFAFIQIIIGLMFLEGIWHNKGAILKSYIDLDALLFRGIKDKRLLKRADQLAFEVCLLMATFTLINGLVDYFIIPVPNISAIFIFCALFLSWPIRISFIAIYKTRNYNEVPKIWPFHDKNS